MASRSRWNAATRRNRSDRIRPSDRDGGHAVHVTGRESWPIATGDVFFISGPRAHEYRDMQKRRLINILFRPENLQLDLWDLPALPG